MKKKPVQPRVVFAALYPRVERDDYGYFSSYNNYHERKQWVGKKQATCPECGHRPPAWSDRPLGALDRHFKQVHPMLWRPLIIEEEDDIREEHTA